MTALPLIMSASMVRAILREIEQPGSGKTMTRRLFKMDREPPPKWNGRFGFSVFTPARHVELRGYDDQRGPLSRFMRLRWFNGDRLWVRETVACGACAPSKPSYWAPSFWRREQGTSKNPNGLWYASDGLEPEKQITERGRWVPSIHMPRWASRLTLVVRAVKIERLQDISEKDAIAEGAYRRQDGYWTHDGEHAVAGEDPAKYSFRMLWEVLHGCGSWDANPYVVAISFTPHLCNVDQMKEAA